MLSLIHILDAWRADVAGKRGNKTATIRDVVEAVQSLCVSAGDTTKAGKICDIVHEDTGACVRTIKQRIKEATREGYLLASKKVRGEYSLGPKPLPK